MYLFNQESITIYFTWNYVYAWFVYFGPILFILQAWQKTERSRVQPKVPCNQANECYVSLKPNGTPATPAGSERVSVFKSTPPTSKTPTTGPRIEEMKRLLASSHFRYLTMDPGCAQGIHKHPLGPTRPKDAQRPIATISRRANIRLMQNECYELWKQHKGMEIPNLFY